jgi:glucokinase
MMRVLAGDIGGTKTDLRLYVGTSPSALTVERQGRFDSQAFSGLTPILGEFLRGESVDAAGFGVAGPVLDGACRTTNLPWLVTVAELQKVCATPHCALLNDVQVAALGIPWVADDRKVWLQRAPIDPQAPVELVAVGTGFGRAFVIPGAGAFATESGHASFAPRNVIEKRLFDYLNSRVESVAVEHVLSGPSIFTLYQFVVEQGLAPATAQLEIERADDPSAAIGRLGVRDLDPASAAAVALFVDLLGSELGNIALSTLPRGGFYLWGGVALKLRPALEEGLLLDAFRDKDRMQDVLRTIPLALLDEPELGIMGALTAGLTALGAA